MTIGEHCNNPLNMRATDTNWVGKIGQYKGFVKFDTMEHGLRAAMLNLLTYMAKYKLTNVKAIVSRWAPPSENDTKAYIRVVTKAVHADSVLPWYVTQYYDLKTEEDFVALVAAMAMVECGFRNGEMIVNVYDRLKKEPLVQSKRAVLNRLEENSLNNKK